jgi:hypothetical protein
MWQNPLLKEISNPESAIDILERSGCGFQVRLARLFVANSDGTFSSEEDLKYVVLCDLSGTPIQTADGLIVKKVYQKDTKPRWLKVPGPENEIRVKEDSQLFSVNNHYALDLIEDALISYSPVAGVSGQFAEKYKCKDGSVRATVAFANDGQPMFLGVVGSRYTTMQNIEISEIGYQFLTNLSERTKSGANYGSVLAGGNAHIFRVVISIREQLFANTNLAPEFKSHLDLIHSHDGTLAFHNIFTITEETLPSKPVMMKHHIRLKHTKNILARSSLVNDTIDEMVAEYNGLVKSKLLLEKHVINKIEDVNALLKVDGMKWDPPDWVKVGVRKLFQSEDFSTVRGWNLWTLFLAVCEHEGRYWDIKTDAYGLPELVKNLKAFQLRRGYLKHFLEVATTSEL